MKTMSNEQMERAIRDLQDALVVQGELEARLARGLRQAAEWLEAHESRLNEQDASKEAQEERTKAYEARMERIETNLAEATDKLNALIKFVARQHNLPEA